MSEAAPAGHPTLSVIVPVYNERNTVAEIVRRMRMVTLPVEREIVMVDDGSTDGTDKILAALEDSTIHVVRHPANRGKGAAVRSGLASARGELILLQDADLEYDPEDWPRLLRPVLRGRARVVYGSRFTGEHMNMRFGQWFGNRLLSLLTNVLYGTTLSDVGTPSRLFDRAVLDGVTIESDHFDFEPELTAKILRRGHRIYEVPVSYAGRDRLEGRKYSRRDRLRALATLLRYRFRRSA